MNQQGYRVHTLYRPPEGVEHDTTIILFHGLSSGPDGWKSTWMTRGPQESQVCWPSEWLPKHFGGKVVVLAPTYDSSPHGVNNDVSDIGHNLSVGLICSKGWKLEDPNKSPSIILIGHSFGGLVIKSMLCVAHQIANQRCHNESKTRAAADCKTFIQNLKGVVFYSVPHCGTKEDFFKYWTRTFGKGTEVSIRSGRLAGIMKNLKEFSRQMQQLTVDFNNYVPANMPIFAFIEGEFMPGKKDVLVPDASAMHTAGLSSLYKVEGANHFEVCRPRGENDVAHQKLIEFLDEEVGSLCISSASTTPELLVHYNEVQ